MFRKWLERKRHFPAGCQYPLLFAKGLPATFGYGFDNFARLKHVCQRVANSLSQNTTGRK
jgi:hypothetical protein